MTHRGTTEPRCVISEGSGAAETRIYSWYLPLRCPRTRPAPIHVPWRATVASRPPNGRVFGVTVARPSPASTVSASLLRADTGKRGEGTRSEFASEGAPGFAVSVGDTTGPGVDEDLAS
jgi:hypothetical protein